MLEPIEYHRDRANDEIKYASSTVSQNARTIGVGLVVVVYSLVIASDKASFVREHHIELISIGVLGILCVAFDYLQYYFSIFENNFVLMTLQAEKIEISNLLQTDKSAANARFNQFMRNLDFIRQKTRWSKLREICFHAKFVFAMLGASIIIYMILRLVLTVQKAADFGVSV
jgi:hypothetical protein